MSPSGAPMDSLQILHWEESVLVTPRGREPISVSFGKGSHLFDSAGNRFLDFTGCDGGALVGHCHPRVVEAVQTATARMTAAPGRLACETRARAADALIERAPEGFTRVVFCLSSSEANELALTIAKRRTARDDIVAFEGSFHGSTLGARMVSGIERYRPRSEQPTHTLFLPFADGKTLEGRVSTLCAAAIVEPIQMLGGIRTPPQEFFKTLDRTCRREGTLIIFDEVWSGLGRSGHWFSSEWTGIIPDIITITCGLGSAVLVGEKVAESLELPEERFGWGTNASYEALRVTLDVIERHDLASRARQMETYIRARLGAYPFVREVRGRGLMLGVTLAKDSGPLHAHLSRRGVLTTRCEDPAVLAFLPPLTITEADCDPLWRALDDYAE